MAPPFLLEPVPSNTCGETQCQGISAWNDDSPLDSGSEFSRGAQCMKYFPATDEQADHHLALSLLKR
jgi:hypothetical protein